MTGKMRKISKQATFLAVALVLLLSYQNCSPLDFGSQGSADSGKTTDESGGQAYDGKIYVLPGLCSDGTSVVARIELKTSTTALLVRENCETIAPRELAPGEFAIDPARPSELIYANRTFFAETAPITVSPLKPGYYQWSNTLRTLPQPSVFFLDGLDYTAAEIQAVKAQGHTIICVITAGVTSTRDADFGQFAAADLGKIQTGSNNDYWVDTRSANVRSIMLKRLDQVRVKGCDGITWDQTDAHTNDSGFPLTFDTGVDFLKFLAFATHDRKLLAVVSHTGELAGRIVDYFDMQFGHNCYAKGFCSRYKVFADKGKPVFIAENTAFSAQQCAEAKASSFSLWYTTPTQDGSRYEPCP